MSPKQAAARRAIECFVRKRGGDVDIRLVPGPSADNPRLVASYRWNAHGDTVAIGWEEATPELADAARKELQI